MLLSEWKIRLVIWIVFWCESKNVSLGKFYNTYVSHGFLFIVIDIADCGNIWYYVHIINVNQPSSLSICTLFYSGIQAFGNEWDEICWGQHKILNTCFNHIFPQLSDWSRSINSLVVISNAIVPPHYKFGFSGIRRATGIALWLWSNDVSTSAS
jgi:hypothetical protein